MHFDKIEESRQRSARNTFRTRRIVAYPGVIVLAFTAAIFAILPLPNSAAIVNGPRVRSAPPWVAFLTHKSNGRRGGSCSGVLISSNLLLSAEHCKGGNLNEATVGSGNLNRNEGDRLKIITFESFPGDDDLAVYQLERDLNRTPIEIDPSSAHSTSATVTLFGYGANSLTPDRNDFLLHKVEGFSSACNPSQRPTKFEFCFESVHADQGPCSGDSGAPIVTPANNLDAIYIGRYIRSDQSEKQCTGVIWRVIDVSPTPVRNWINEMIVKHRLPRGGELKRR